MDKRQNKIEPWYMACDITEKIETFNAALYPLTTLLWIKHQ